MDINNIVSIFKEDEKNIVTDNHIQIFKEKYYKKEVKEMLKNIKKDGSSNKERIFVFILILLLNIIAFSIEFINPFLFLTIPMIFISFILITINDIDHYFIFKNKNDINIRDILMHKLYNDKDFKDIFNDDFIQFSKLINKYSCEEQESALKFIKEHSNSQNLIKYINLAENDNIELSLDFMKQIHQQTPPLLTKSEDFLVKIIPIFEFYKINNVEELIDMNHDDYKFIKDNKDNYNLNNDELKFKRFNNSCNRFYQINNGNTDKINALLRISRIFKSHNISDENINEQFKYVKENFQLISIIELNKLEYDTAKMVH